MDSVYRAVERVLLLDIESDHKHARRMIDAGVRIKGTRLWFLLASCLIASIGLNTNSSAVIIGAMLISPLMGPILGLGFGMAVASKRIIRASALNLAFAVTVTLAVASVYFVVSPFQDATLEILSRTSPTLLDLLVAVAAAFAGVVAISSSSLSSALPGVAIATSVMPPLCASAYGIAHGNWKVALGAFYLFFVNGLAITVVAFLVLKRMRFVDDHDQQENGKLRPAVVSVALMLIIAPLGWSLWGAWRVSFVNRSVSRLVESYKVRLEVVSWHWDGKKSKKLVLYNFRKISPGVRAELETALEGIAPGATLELHESTMSPDMEELANQLKNSQLSALVSNPRVMEGLIRLANSEASPVDLMATVLQCESDLSALTGASGLVRGFVRSQADSSEVVFLISAKSQAERYRILRERARYLDWIQTKLPEGVSVKVEVN